MRIQGIINQTGKSLVVENKTVVLESGKVVDLTKPLAIKCYAKHLKLSETYKTQSLDEAKVNFIDALLRDFNFDKEHFGKIISDLDRKDNGNLFYKVVEFIDDPFKKSLLFYGEESYGTGKTQCIQSIAFAWYNNPLVDIVLNNYGEVTIKYTGYSIQVVREVDLMQRILSTFNNKSATESEAQVYRDLSKYDILAIDDVGKYKANDMNFYRRVMFQIIDTRYNNHQGIIISSNLSKDNLGRFIGKANVDRLRGMAGEYKLEFKGQSHRGS